MAASGDRQKGPPWRDQSSPRKRWEESHHPTPSKGSIQFGFRVWAEKLTIFKSFVGKRQPEGTPEEGVAEEGAGEGGSTV